MEKILMFGLLKSLSQKHPLAVYIVINYTISWALLYPTFKLLLAARGSFPPLALLGLVGGYGPSLAALLMLALAGGREGVRTGLRQFLQWRRPVHYYLFVLIGPICIYIVAVLANLRPVADFKSGLQAIPLAFLVALPFGPLGEELGWRGYLLPQLLKRHDAVTASLIVGVAWAAWHIPAFVFPGAAIPSFFAVSAWSIFLFACSIMAEAFAFTYLFLKTKGSLILAILLHMAFNASPNIAEGLFPALENANAVRGRIYITDFAILSVCVFACLVFDRTVRGRLAASGVREVKAGSGKP
jgi:membrane protease YdiL (CAAX protease family)